MAGGRAAVVTVVVVVLACGAGLRRAWAGADGLVAVFGLTAVTVGTVAEVDVVVVTAAARIVAVEAPPPDTSTMTATAMMTTTALAIPAIAPQCGPDFGAE